MAELKPAAEERGTRGVLLHIPSSFAPSAVKSARPTQTATQSFAAQAPGATRLTVHVGAEMADEISGVYVPRLDTFAFKRSATKACVAFHTPLGGPDLEIIVRTKQSNPSR